MYFSFNELFRQLFIAIINCFTRSSVLYIYPIKLHRLALCLPGSSPLTIWWLPYQKESKVILSEVEEMLVIVVGAAIFMAIIGNTIKDYRRMRWEAKKQLIQKEEDEALVRNLKKIIDQKNEQLQKAIEEKKQNS